MLITTSDFCPQTLNLILSTQTTYKTRIIRQNTHKKILRITESQWRHTISICKVYQFTELLTSSYFIIFLLLFGLWGYWHCGHSWAIVPASGDSEVKMIVEKQMECTLAGETEVLGENLPQRHFCPSQNPTWPDPGLNPGHRGSLFLTIDSPHFRAIGFHSLHNSHLFTLRTQSFSRLPYATRRVFIPVYVFPWTWRQQVTPKPWYLSN
jgi:hypothetical protein